MDMKEFLKLCPSGNWKDPSIEPLFEQAL